MSDVLVIDDTDHEAELTLRALKNQRLDLEVLRLKDAQQALDYLWCAGGFAQRVSPQPLLVISDIYMPGMNGFDLTEQLRAHPVTADISIVLFSSSDNPLLDAAAERVGANEFVLKPWSFEQYETCVSDMLRRWGLQSHSVLPAARSLIVRLTERMRLQ